MRENGCPCEVAERPAITSEEADAYAFHKFHTRQFEYVEKLRFQLQHCSPADIPVNIAEAKQQYNVLVAARSDLLVAIIRFTNYGENKK